MNKYFLNFHLLAATIIIFSMPFDCYAQKVKSGAGVPVEKGQTIRSDSQERQFSQSIKLSLEKPNDIGEIRLLWSFKKKIPSLEKDIASDGLLLASKHGILELITLDSPPKKGEIKGNLAIMPIMIKNKQLAPLPKLPPGHYAVRVFLLAHKIKSNWVYFQVK